MSIQGELAVARLTVVLILVGQVVGRVVVRHHPRELVRLGWGLRHPGNGSLARCTSRRGRRDRRSSRRLVDLGRRGPGLLAQGRLSGTRDALLCCLGAGLRLGFEMVLTTPSKTSSQGLRVVGP